LSQENVATNLTVAQDHLETEEEKHGSEQNCGYVMENLKRFLEKTKKAI
jgi:hypothetical protein